MNVIICPPPDPPEPMPERARASAGYLLDAARRGIVSMDDTLKLRIVQQRIRELEATP